MCKVVYLVHPVARCNLLKYRGDNTVGMTAWAKAVTAADRGVDMCFKVVFAMSLFTTATAATAAAIELVNVDVADAFDNRRGGGGGGGGIGFGSWSEERQVRCDGSTSTVAAIGAAPATGNSVALDTSNSFFSSHCATEMPSTSGNRTLAVNGPGRGKGGAIAAAVAVVAVTEDATKLSCSVVAGGGANSEC